MTALSRLQREGKLFAFGSDALPGATLDQQVTLAGTPGQQLPRGNREQRTKFRGARIPRSQTSRGKAKQPGSSKLVFTREMGSGGKQPFQRPWFSFERGSRQLGPGRAHQLATAGLVKLGAAAGESSGGWSGESLSSWAQGVESSWGISTLSSWFQGAQSSLLQRGSKQLGAGGHLKLAPGGSKQLGAGGHRELAPGGSKQLGAGGHLKLAPGGSKQLGAGGRLKLAPGGAEQLGASGALKLGSGLGHKLDPSRSDKLVGRFRMGGPISDLLLCRNLYTVRIHRR